jgi:hypothetical protein
VHFYWRTDVRLHLLRYDIPMTIAEVRPLIEKLSLADKRVLTNELLAEYQVQEAPVHPAILDMVQDRIAYSKAHPEESMPMAEFEAMMDGHYGQV